jgi:hypothetical protein
VKQKSRSGIARFGGRNLKLLENAVLAQYSSVHAQIPAESAVNHSCAEGKRAIE